MHLGLAVGMVLLGLTLLVTFSPAVSVHAGEPAGGLRSAADDYAVTFYETGLPSGTSWAVTMAGSTLGSTTDSIAFSEPSGTYEFTVGSIAGYTADISVGNVTVEEVAVSQSIAFSPSVSDYGVTFVEIGLPSGTSWNVTFAGVTMSSSSNDSGSYPINYVEPNGTYSFVVGTIAGYTATPGYGEITVNGVAATETVSFALSNSSGTGASGSLSHGGGSAGLSSSGWTVVAAVGSAGVAGSIGGTLIYRRQKAASRLASLTFQPGEDVPPRSP